MEEIPDTLANMVVIFLADWAKKDGGLPISVVIVGVNPLVEIAKRSMNGAMPISSMLCWQKAYTTVMTKKDTIFWADWQAKGKCIDNFCDPNFTAFPGAKVIYDPEEPKKVLGAIGVSGRNGRKETTDKLLQDHELAGLGARYLEELLAAHQKKTGSLKSKKQHKSKRAQSFQKN